MVGLSASALVNIKAIPSDIVILFRVYVLVGFDEVIWISNTLKLDGGIGIVTVISLLFPIQPKPCPQSDEAEGFIRKVSKLGKDICLNIGQSY